MRICVTAFVFGNYKRFVPVFCYSVVRSYPEYSVRIFIDGELSADERDSINAIRERYPGSVDIEEHAFEGAALPSTPKIRGGSKMFLRWLFERADFSGFDGVYFSDIDFLALRHDPPLGEFHMENARRLGLPFSNMVRVNKADASQCSRRLSGLHFVVSDEYFSRTEPLVRQFKDDPGLIADAVPDATTNEQFLFYLVMNSIPFDWRALCDAPRPTPGLNLAWADNSQRLATRTARLMSSSVDRGPRLEDVSRQLHAFCDDPLFLRLLWNGKVPEAATLLWHLGIRPEKPRASRKLLVLVLQANMDRYWRIAKLKLGGRRRPRYSEG